jgi:hypothetical protein
MRTLSGVPDGDRGVVKDLSGLCVLKVGVVYDFRRFALNASDLALRHLL